MKKLLSILTIGLFAVQLNAQTARVQVIHNSADAAASTVDIYIDANLAIDDFEFRTATGFLDLPAGSQFLIGVAPANSSSQADTIVSFPVTLMANETYIVVADGIVSPTGYSPAPAFGLEVYAMGREAASTMGNTDVLVHHGSTDAPTVDVVETGVGAGTIVDDLAYTDFQGYLELATDDYVLEIRDETGATTVASYDAPLSTLGLGDSALVVVASGFLTPADNSNGPAFGLWVALPAGGDMIELPATATTGLNELINAADWKIYPNPASGILNLSFEDNQRRQVEILNTQGQVVSDNILNDAFNTMSVSNLNDGFYMIKITDAEGNVGVKSLNIAR